MTRTDNQRVEDILRARDSRRLQEIAASGRAAFDRSWPLQDAAIRELELLGEAMNKLSDEFKERVSGLPIEVARGLRNVVTHVYWAIDLDVIWDTILNDIGPLIATLENEYTPPPTGSVLEEDFTFPRADLV